MNKKPELLQSFPLPLTHLTPDSFEDFVYSSLVLLGRKKGFEMQSGRQPSGDKGFDCTAKTIDKKELICIQCKRYSTTLYKKTIVQEIIKVALEGVLHNSSAKQHYIITASTVAEDVRRSLREDSYTTLKDDCIKIIEDGSFQPKVIETVKDRGIDPIQTIKNYLDALDKLIVWSTVDFRNELLGIWDELSNLLEHHFVVTKILKDHPTPNFDLTEYLNKNNTSYFQLAPLHYSPTLLPHNLECSHVLQNINIGIFSLNDLMNLLMKDTNIVLSSPGGSGKSSTLSMLKRNLLNNKADLEFIPVKIKLRSYSRNSLSSMIQKQLGISYGSWQNLPFKFIFLFDGLDEMLEYDTQAFFDDLKTVTMNTNYSYILTIRNTGLNINVSAIPKQTICFSIQPLSYRNTFDIASHIFKGAELQSFNDDYRHKLSSIGNNFLSSPFALTLSIEYYKQYQKLPDNIEELLESWIDSKITEDQKRITNSNLKKNKIPKSYIENIFSSVLYKFYFEKRSNKLSESLFYDLLIECFEDLKSAGSGIPKLLDYNDFIETIKQYEILSKIYDNTYTSPHLIISEYLSAKALAQQWHTYKNYSFNYSHYNIWLYCSNFIKDEDKNEFFNTTLKFNINLATEVAKKFPIVYRSKIEEQLLLLEQSTKVITRSDAIQALGVLGSQKCLERLKSQNHLKDQHHLFQRQRSLAINGDKDTLHTIFTENIQQAQAPVKLSGGSYSLWFQSPPALITNIARENLKKWEGNKNIPLCLSLRTIKLFGDISDIRILTSIINTTNNDQEFYDALGAMYFIDKKNLIKLLNELISNQNSNSYWAKKFLSSIQEPINIDNEFDLFVNYSSCTEAELDSENIFYILRDLYEFLSKNILDDRKIDILKNTYKNLTFKTDFYYYNYIWMLALNGPENSFIPIVELAYERKDPNEMHYAIGYLSSLDNLKIEDPLSKKIDAHFKSLPDDQYGTLICYAHYYYKHKCEKIGLEIIEDSITKKLQDLSPETINNNQYTSSNIFEYIFIFQMLSLNGISKNANIGEDNTLKLLLINTENNKDNDSIKLKMLRKLKKTTLDNYIDQIQDDYMKFRIVNYLLLNNLSDTPSSLFAKYLPNLLSNHLFYPTIKTVSENYWSNDLAKIFLDQFLNFSWHPISAQMFEDYTSIFLELLTPEQLRDSEKNRKKPINPNIQRIYNIWLEHSNIQSNKI